MKDFLRERHVPSTLSSKISTFYTMAARKQVLEDEELMKGLSSQLRTELLMFLYRNTLEKVPFFEARPPIETCLVSRGGHGFFLLLWFAHHTSSASRDSHPVLSRVKTLNLSRRWSRS